MTLPKIKVFIDSDVIISSLISARGAAHFLLHDRPELTLIIANSQLTELNQVVKRLKLKSKNLNDLLKKKFEVVKSKKLGLDIEKLTSDPHDQHITVGIISAKPKFFVSYNLKHFHTEKIKIKLGTICLTPAQLLQYLRSLN